MATQLRDKTVVRIEVDNAGSRIAPAYSVDLVVDLQAGDPDTIMALVDNAVRRLAIMLSGGEEASDQDFRANLA